MQLQSEFMSWFLLFVNVIYLPVPRYVRKDSKDCIQNYIDIVKITYFKDTNCV